MENRDQGVNRQGSGYISLLEHLITAAQRYHPGVQHIISDLKYPEQRLDFTPDLLLPVFRSQHHQVKDLFLLHISHPVHQQVCSFYLRNILQSYFLPHCHLSPGFPLSLI